MPPDTGRIFRTGDVTFPARADYVVDTVRCTTLGCAGTRVLTVEHLLSALAACGVDNAWIVVSGPEIPILDGSALPFLRAIRSAGVIGQGVATRVIRPAAPREVVGDSGSITVVPAQGLTLDVTTDFVDWPEGCARCCVEIDPKRVDFYEKSVAPARTFAFRQEVDRLLAAGLARGGSVENALIISPPDGYSTPLRLPHEWAAHKALDVLGDLALLDARLESRVTARCPGHRLNTQCARLLLEEVMA